MLAYICCPAGSGQQRDNNVFNFHKEIQSFRAAHVRLSNDQQQEMRSRRAANLKRIREGLAANKKPAYAQEIKQGGYKHKTMVQPPEINPDESYDIDNAIVFEMADADVTPFTARERVRAALAVKGGQFKEEPKSKKKCVRVIYADGKQCDFPVMRRDQDIWGNWTYELAAGDEWLARDSTEISDWVDERVGTLSPETDGHYQLRRIIQMVKQYAKTHAHRNRHAFPAGIVISALVIEHYVAKAGRDDEAFRETLRGIQDWAGTPVYAATECVADTDKDAERIERLVSQAAKTVELLDDLDAEGTNPAQAREVWKKVFHHSFFAPLAEAAKAATAAGAGGFANPAVAHRAERHVDARKQSGRVIPPYCAPKALRR